MDQEQHPRQSNWSNQFIIENFSMFKTQDEWTAFDTTPINSGQNLAKKTPANVGIAVPYVVWAKAIWSKWTRFRSHIINTVNVDFKALLVRGRLKSGIQTSEVVELLRRKYFDEWCTTTAGVVTHIARPITECPDWVPGAWWHSFIALGAPQGQKAAAPLMALEDSSTLAEVEELPKPINDLLTERFEGRKVQRELHQKKATSETVSGHASSSRKADTHTPIKTFEAHLKERDAMINRLNQLISFPGMCPVKVEGFRKELLAVMMKPIVSLESCGSPPFLAVSSSHTVTDDEMSLAPVKLADSFEGAEALSLSDCVLAANQPEVMATAAAGAKFAKEKLGQIHNKTSSFHSMVVEVPANVQLPLFQMRKQPADDSGSFNFIEQRNLHLDGGFDPEFWTDNDEYAILSRDDVLKHQPLFLENFKKRFNVHYEDSTITIQTEFSRCCAQDTLFFAFATLVNDRSLRIRDLMRPPNSCPPAPSPHVPVQTSDSMRTSLFRHIKGFHGDIPGAPFKFIDEQSYVLDFNGDLSEYLDVKDRGGDPLFIHAFCHKFEFDLLLFSVKDPGGTLYLNQENANVDVCSILFELNVDQFNGHDKFYLAVPKLGAVASETFSSSFLIGQSDEKTSIINAENEAREKLDFANAFLLQVRSDILQSDSHIRYRRDEVNRKIRLENEEKLVAADNAYMEALRIAERLSVNQPASRAVLPVLVDESDEDEFEDYHRHFQELPEYTVDIEIAFVSPEIGRGLRALRKFKKGDTLGHYNGHRCDSNGKVIIHDPETDALFFQFQNLNLDREVSGAVFQKSHALCLGQTHLSGLVIDGGPLCDPRLDHVRDRRGAFAAANSAASASAANAKPIWVKAPHFPRDKINNLANRVCIFVAKRDIE